MCPAIASGIVTEDALVSYWPMLLAIITICTRAQLHSKTISGFACVASVSVRFLSKESQRPRELIFGSRSTFHAATRKRLLATQGISECNYFLRYFVLASG